MMMMHIPWLHVSECKGCPKNQYTYVYIQKGGPKFENIKGDPKIKNIKGVKKIKGGRKIRTLHGGPKNLKYKGCTKKMMMYYRM